MEGKEISLADLMAALTSQTQKMDAQTQKMDEKLDSQYAGIREEISGCVDRVLKESKAYVEEECQRVKSEVLSEVFTKGEVKVEVERVVSDLKNYVDSVVAGQAAPPLGDNSSVRPKVKRELVSEAEDAGSSDVECKSNYSSGDHGSAGSRGKHQRASPAPRGFLTPPRSPVNVLSPPPTPPGSVKSLRSGASSTSRRCRDGARRRPQEFDGTVSWEAYRTQFELLASARQWSRPEMAMQLVWALKGGALEILSQLPPDKRSSYSSVTAALERRYGYQHQTEAFRARFRSRVRGPGETLTRLAQDLELLVRRAYPEASEDMVTILLRDQFVDAIDSQQLRIYVQQAHPKDLQEALARGLELESFLRTTRERPSAGLAPSHKVKARKGRVGTPPSTSPPPSGVFRGKCYTCGQVGHSKRYCSQGKGDSKPDSAGAGKYQYKPCCWNCGKAHKTPDCTHAPAGDSKKATGNQEGLAEGVERQSDSSRPHAA